MTVPEQSRRSLRIGASSALLGAIVAFLIQAQLEGNRFDNELQRALSAVMTQTAQILENQSEIREELLQQKRWLSRVDDQISELIARQDRLESKQGELEQGAIKLRTDLQGWAQRPVYIRNGGSDVGLIGYEALAEVAAEILRIEADGKPDVWIAKGPPYARTELLSARLSRRISAAERDQAAALIVISRFGRRQ